MYCHSLVFIAVPSQQVIDLRPGTCFVLLHPVLPLFQKLMDFASRIVQIAEYAYLRRTGFDAGRKLSTIQPMRAQIALLDHPQIFAEEARIVRASNHAVAAADAFGGVNRDHAVRALIGSACRANPYAGRILAVVALFRLEYGHQLRPITMQFFVDPIPAFTNGHSIFGPAGNYTSLAVDAFLRVNCQRIAFRSCRHRGSSNFSDLYEGLVERGSSRDLVPCGLK